MTIIPFFSERLGNINALRATISVDKRCPVDRELAVKDNSLWLGSTKLIDSTVLGIPLDPNLITTTNMDQQPDKNNETILWDIKIGTQQQQVPRLAYDHEPKELLPAKALREFELISCNHCSCPLVRAQDSKAPFRHKDMPSEHWYELVECWICHETKPEEHRARMKPILAKPDVLLVGSTYYLVHSDNLTPDSLVVDRDVASKINWDNGTYTKWITVNCTSCSMPLGEGQYEKYDEEPILRAVKLFKYCVSILPTPTLTPCEMPTFMDFLVCDLVNAAKAHATYRFLIQGRNTGKIYCLIWLFNWDTQIIYNRGFVSPSEPADVYHERG
ncbi:HECT-like ubiquitin-conjugating enzyme-binding-domain-containing protein [Phycomyces blakesleeanus]|uniref:HECT-like ubiquitin-conjugating enzyme-binding-domain-containing protein n=1 Tax=Phycomyces blakesleeanus TaxID=4837 RepID=A0ABR3BBA1_PHYBL